MDLGFGIDQRFAWGAMGHKVHAQSNRAQTTGRLWRVRCLSLAKGFPRCFAPVFCAFLPLAFRPTPAHGGHIAATRRYFGSQSIDRLIDWRHASSVNFGRSRRRRLCTRCIKPPPNTSRQASSPNFPFPPLASLFLTFCHDPRDQPTITGSAAAATRPSGQCLRLAGGAQRPVRGWFFKARVRTDSNALVDV